MLTLLDVDELLESAAVLDSSTPAARLRGGRDDLVHAAVLLSYARHVLSVDIGALRAIHHRNLTVPGDFSVIGFDDIELSDILHPPLTTLHLSRQKFAQIFFDALEAMREQPHADGQQYSIQTSLVIRESTGRVKSPVKRRNRR